MNPNLFLSNLPQDEILKLSPEEMQERISAEQEFMNKQPHKDYLAATNGSKTKNGGLVRATINKRVEAEGYFVAAVGDEVIYEDGTTAKIISGAGEEGEIEGFEMAIVGSRLDNGDEIIDSLQSGFVFRIYDHKPIPKGFLNHG